MAGRERMRLTDAAIARLRPREREYTVWDSKVPGLGVRVRPSGGRSYVLLRDVGGRSKRVSIGPVSTMTVAEARRECLARQASPEPDSVNGGAKMPHARRPGGPVAAAQKCATYGPLSVLARGGGCTAWSSMRRFGWRLSMRG